MHGQRPLMDNVFVVTAHSASMTRSCIQIFNVPLEVDLAAWGIFHHHCHLCVGPSAVQQPTELRMI
eukprot:12404678-Karenia_brevis.AAC.1